MRSRKWGDLSASDPRHTTAGIPEKEGSPKMNGQALEYSVRWASVCCTEARRWHGVMPGIRGFPGGGESGSGGGMAGGAALRAGQPADRRKPTGGQQISRTEEPDTPSRAGGIPGASRRVSGQRESPNTGGEFLGAATMKLAQWLHQPPRTLVQSIPGRAPV